MRALGRWLPATATTLERKICVGAASDVLLHEVPHGSNRGPEIDEMNKAVGLPEEFLKTGKAYWCCSWLCRVWREAGAEVPGSKGTASCDELMKWGKKRGTFSKTPSLGAAVLYGPNENDANHIGVVIMLDPVLCSCEGNTSTGGFDRNGWAVDIKRVDTARVLGYVKPTPAANFHDARGGSSTTAPA
jgi:hypothetical protein